MIAPPSLDEGPWLGVGSLDLVEVLSGSPLSWPTSVRVGWTEDALWVRFGCTASTVRATMTRYKDRVWQEDAVEVYLRTPADPYLYEFQLNPIGTARDLRVSRAGDEDQEFDDSWACTGLITTAAIDRGPDRNISGWRAMFGFPWRSFPAPGPHPSGWQIGLFRIERESAEFGGLRWCRRESLELHDPRLMARLELRP